MKINKGYHKRYSKKGKIGLDSINLSKNSLIVFAAFAFFVFVVFLYVFSDTSLPIGKGCVAVVKISGELTTQGEPSSLFNLGRPSSDQIASLIESLDKKDNVKAIVIEMNSPGGSVVASREIYEALKEVKKPKVVYIRELGASGGYYVSVAADKIIANPDAITGSIGVITTFTDLRGLLSKIGANFTSITSGKHKDLGAFYRGMTDEERTMIQDLVNSIYKEFYNVVKENRGDKLHNFDSIADGRILTGKQALEYGLVDKTGNFKDALRMAADMANMSYDDIPDTCEYSALSTESPFAGMLSGFKLTMQFNQNSLQLKS